MDMARIFQIRYSVLLSAAVRPALGSAGCALSAGASPLAQRGNVRWNRRPVRLHSIRDSAWLPACVRDERASSFDPSSEAFRRLEPLFISSLFSGTALGLSVALAARRRSAFRTPLPKQVWAPAPESASWPWEPGPARGSARCALSRSGDQTQRRSSCTGTTFHSSDSQARTPRPAPPTTKKPYTVLSLATQSSYKDKNTGEYINRTEWHRVIVWGKLGEFAQKIQKGAHLAVDGELVSREFADKKHQDVKHRILGSSRHIHPQARPRREVRPGRAARTMSSTRKKRPTRPVFFTPGSPAKRRASIAGNTRYEL